MKVTVFIEKKYKKELALINFNYVFLLQAFYKDLIFSLKI